MVVVEMHIRMFITHMMCLMFPPVHNTPVHSHHRKVIYDCATDSFGRKVCHISFARRRTIEVVFDCSYSGGIDYEHTTHILHREKKDHFQKH